MRKESLKKEGSYLLMMLFTFVVFLCSCEQEELLQEPDSDASGKISGIDFRGFADTTEVDTIFLDTIRDESLLDLYGDNPIGFAQAKPKPEAEHIGEPVENNEDEEKEKEELIGIGESTEIEVGTTEPGNWVVPVIEETAAEEESIPAVYIHVKWGCNGNDSVIELIEEHTDDSVFDGISYEWVSDTPFSNSINTSNYALLSYVEPGMEEDYAYNVSLNITTNTMNKTFDFCFFIEGDELVNCGENENMMTTACGVGLQSLQVGINIAFKAGKSSCYFFPVKPVQSD